MPDATIAIDEVQKQCNSRTISVDFTISNFNSTNPLPAGTPVAIYINGQFIQYTETLVAIPIDGTISDQISIVIPNDIPIDFELLFVVDDTGNGSGIVTEIIETNNSFSTTVSLLRNPEFATLQTLISCNEGLTKGIFDFSNYEDLVKVNPDDTTQFFETYQDADAEINPILNTTNYVAVTTPKEIFIRIENQDGCYSITSFLLTTRNCPPIIYNYVSANNDPYNETFFIGGLRDIFINFKLEVYNRWGILIWTGNNNLEDWDGYVKNGVGNSQASDGTYYYVLHLNDPDYTNPMTGFLFLKQ